MITEHDLQEAIAECEGQRNPSANTCLKLAAFYIVKDKMFPENKESDELKSTVNIPRYSYASASLISDSEFMQVVSNMDKEEFVPIMDELMTTLKAIIPKLYDGVMRKLTEI